MWKYVSRRIRDTFERTATHKRSAAGLVNTQNDYDGGKKSFQPCQWFSSQKCSNTSQSNNNTNEKKWNFDHLNGTWIGAITWSSALVVGWYTSQLIHLKYKYHNKHTKCQSFSDLKAKLNPFVTYASQNALCVNTTQNIEEIVGTFKSDVQFISNEHNDVHKSKAQGSGSSKSNNSDNDLRDVLNSIENRLGLAAIENGKPKDGLNLLRSAAHRHHAPAMYNLGLCYELGVGVKVDEKIAMELYRSAAALEHPGALYNLSVYYGQGRGGLLPDITMATRLLRLAAVQGQTDAIKALKSLDIETEEQNANWIGKKKCEMQTPTKFFLKNANAANLCVY